MAPEEELKLTQIANGGHSGLAVMMCHSQGLCEIGILILVLRYDWLISEDKKQWELGKYYVTCVAPLKTNFSKQIIFWKTEEMQERRDWVSDQLQEMIRLYIKDRTDDTTSMG